MFMVHFLQVRCTLFNKLHQLNSPKLTILTKIFYYTWLFNGQNSGSNLCYQQPQFTNCGILSKQSITVGISLLAATTAFKLGKNATVLAADTDTFLTIGNESAQILLAQCRFPGLAISNAKILIYFSNKIYKSVSDWVSEQFLNGTSAHYRLLSAIKLEVTKSSES